MAIINSNIMLNHPPDASAYGIETIPTPEIQTESNLISNMFIHVSIRKRKLFVIKFLLLLFFNYFNYFIILIM